jgi:quercetin dioxygenase-like cupin family protein
MEIIVSVSETKPGEGLARHIHHGEEALYVLEGATVELPDGKQITLATGGLESMFARSRMPDSRSSATRRSSW